MSCQNYIGVPFQQNGPYQSIKETSSNLAYTSHNTIENHRPYPRSK